MRLPYVLQRLIPAVVLLGCAVLWQFALPERAPDQPSGRQKLANKHEPYDAADLRWAWPDTSVDIQAYLNAMRLAQADVNQVSLRSSALWQQEGPADISGRINVVALDPNNKFVMYAGAAAGGVFKSTDMGDNWTPIFDQFPYLAIGEITIDPSNSRTLYVGTGDPNIGSYVQLGNGLYRSTDAGASWTHLGLANTRIISKVIVKPDDPNTLYVAAMGNPFTQDGNRGVYKSTDGGATWTRVLFVNTQAGITDLVMDWSDYNTLYAVSWDRRRSNRATVAAGRNGKIWKSIDGGATWAQLSQGLPSGSLSRIGIAQSQTEPNSLFAVVTDSTFFMNGVYQSQDGGNVWNPISTDSMEIYGDPLGGFGWYFGKIRVNPANDSNIWVLGVDLWVTENGGYDWERGAPPWYFYDVHADKHDFKIHPTDPNMYVLATDGSVNISLDGGRNWSERKPIPITQFYRIETNPHEPLMFYGGAQDQGTMGGAGMGPNDWARIYGGDGFQMRFDPRNRQTWYCETQNGGLVFTQDGGQNYGDHTIGIDFRDRFNWDMPFVLAPGTGMVQYTGTHRMYKNLRGPGATWRLSSPDLTDGNIYGSRFHTISAISVSSVDTSIVYAGTTDGNVWASFNGGGNWTQIQNGLPDRYVTSIQASPFNETSVYVTFSGYRDNDNTPHIFRSGDQGNTWTPIGGNLPNIAINKVLAYPVDPILFIGTDNGVYFTVDETTWYRAGANLPSVAVYDLAFTIDQQRLVAGTHGRSMWSISIDSLLTNTPIAVTPPVERPLRMWTRPLDAELVLELPPGLPACEVSLYNMSGSVLRNAQLQGRGTLSLQGLPTGVYIVRAQHGRQRFTGKLLWR